MSRERGCAAWAASRIISLGKHVLQTENGILFGRIPPEVELQCSKLESESRMTRAGRLRAGAEKLENGNLSFKYA